MPSIHPIYTRRYARTHTNIFLVVEEHTSVLASRHFVPEFVNPCEKQSPPSQEPHQPLAQMYRIRTPCRHIQPPSLTQPGLLLDANAHQL